MSNIRRTRPVAGDKYFITKKSGGYSTCIQGKPRDSRCDVLANCVGYANGAFNEQEDLGYEKYYLNCNAENFIERAISLGLKVVKDPVKGGIMVWQKGATLKGSDGAGHVAHVIDVLNKDAVYTGESAYNGPVFYNSTRKRGNGNWGAGKGYTYRGCIVPTKYKPEPIPEPKPVDLKYKVGDVVEFTGVLYGDSRGNKPGQSRTALKATISIVNDLGNKQYNINNGLGWVAEEDLKHYVEPRPVSKPKYKFKKGTKVVITASGNSDSYGKGSRAFGIGWTREVLKVWEGRPYPYQVGNKSGTTGFYQESDLKKK